MKQSRKGRGRGSEELPKKDVEQRAQWPNSKHTQTARKEGKGEQQTEAKIITRGTEKQRNRKTQREREGEREKMLEDCRKGSRALRLEREEKRSRQKAPQEAVRE